MMRRMLETTTAFLLLFADAMGAMTRVATNSDEPLLSVPADAREKLYAEIPQLQCLQYWLEEDPQLQNDFRDPELDDYRAGSFYWAIRRAAQYEHLRRRCHRRCLLAERSRCHQYCL